MAFALVTGSSGGIGWALARELASRKHDVLLVARTEDTLKKNSEELRSRYGIQADYYATDLSSPGAARQVVNWASTKNYPIDILINNAGYGLWGPVSDVSHEDLGQMMHLNMQTLTDFCKLLIPELKKHSKAFILNVASTAAYQAVPTLTTYAATKAFVLVYSRGLRWELKGTPISVTCVAPGPTSTGFINRAHLEVIKERAEKFSMTAEAVAKISVRGMFARKAEIVPGVMNWVGAKLAEILPKYFPERIARDLYKT